MYSLIWLYGIGRRTNVIHGNIWYDIIRFHYTDSSNLHTFPHDIRSHLQCHRLIDRKLNSVDLLLVIMTLWLQAGARSPTVRQPRVT